LVILLKFVGGRLKDMCDGGEAAAVSCDESVGRLETNFTFPNDASTPPFPMKAVPHFC
jgi:hypothetical protein